MPIIIEFYHNSFQTKLYEVYSNQYNYVPRVGDTLVCAGYTGKVRDVIVDVTKKRIEILFK